MVRMIVPSNPCRFLFQNLPQLPWPFKRRHEPTRYNHNKSQLPTQLNAQRYAHCLKQRATQQVRQRHSVFNSSPRYNKTVYDRQSNVMQRHQRFVYNLIPQRSRNAKDSLYVKKSSTNRSIERQVIPSHGDDNCDTSTERQVIPSHGDDHCDTSTERQGIPSHGDDHCDTSTERQVIPSHGDDHCDTSTERQVIPSHGDDHCDTSTERQVIPSHGDDHCDTSTERQVIPHCYDVIGTLARRIVEDSYQRGRNRHDCVYSLHGSMRDSWLFMSTRLGNR